MFGPNKKVVNRYISSIVKGKSLVLDTRELGTSKALTKKLSEEHWEEPFSAIEV